MAASWGMTDRQHQAYQLWLSGLSYRAIARQMEITERPAWELVQAAIKKRGAQAAVEDREALRTREGDLLDRLQQALLPRALQGHLGAADRVLAIQQRRARLLGLDTPAHVELTGQGGGPLQVDVTELERRLERLVTQPELAPANGNGAGQ